MIAAKNLENDKRNVKRKLESRQNKEGRLAEEVEKAAITQKKQEEERETRLEEKQKRILDHCKRLYFGDFHYKK